MGSRRASAILFILCLVSIPTFLVHTHQGKFSEGGTALHHNDFRTPRRDITHDTTATTATPSVVARRLLLRHTRRPPPPRRVRKLIRLSEFVDESSLSNRQVSEDSGPGDGVDGQAEMVNEAQGQLGDEREHASAKVARLKRLREAFEAHLAQHRSRDDSENAALNDHLGNLGLSADELAAIPFGARMALLKKDTMPDRNETDLILRELDRAAASIRVEQSSNSDPFADAKRPLKSGKGVVRKNSLSFRSTLCTFLPTDAVSEQHEEELKAVLSSWGSEDYGHHHRVAVFTENATLFEALGDKGVWRIHADLTSWRLGHHRRVLKRRLLRTRGSTVRQLRGRGELSLPMWYWLWRSFEDDSTGLAQCDYFMKADTDTFVNVPQLLSQLDTLRSDAPFYVGTPVGFSSQGFNYSQPAMNITYHLGGPGYIVSRGFLRACHMDHCFRTMSRDPIWLIHDDAAIGYCALGRFTSEVQLIAHHATMAATVADHLMTFLEAEHSAVSSCSRCVQSIHPVFPDLMGALWRQSSRRGGGCRQSKVDVDDDQIPFDAPVGTLRACGIRLIKGFQPLVGRQWELPASLFADIRRYFPGGSALVRGRLLAREQAT